MDNNIQVTLSPDLYMMKVKALQDEVEDKDIQIQRLMDQLEHERNLCKSFEERFDKYSKDNTTKSRKRRHVTPKTNAYSDFKSDGKRKAHAADSIRSYDDYHAIEQYYLNRGQIRNWAMWTIGVSLGLRISDLLSLKFGNFIDTDRKTIKPRIQIYEQKTGKLNNCLVTESVKIALDKYLESIRYRFNLNEYLFPSKKTKEKMYEESGWRILSTAGKTLKLPLVIGSHTMRKSFANIVACVDKSCIDMNAITKVQGLLNHSDQRVTMTYLGSYQEMFDRARIAVSEFVLGRTGVNEIIAGNQHTTDDVFERLEALEKIILKSQGAYYEKDHIRYPHGSISQIQSA